jgi:hypothetical protein
MLSMHAKKSVTVATCVSLAIAASVPFSRMSEAQADDMGFTFDDPMVGKAWSDCSAKATLPSKIKTVGKYNALPLDGVRLVLAKDEQLGVYAKTVELSEIDKLNGYVWIGTVSLGIEGPVQVYQAESGHPYSSATWQWQEGKDIGAIVTCSVEMKKSAADKTDVLPWTNQFKEFSAAVYTLFQDHDHVPYPGWK